MLKIHEEIQNMEKIVSKLKQSLERNKKRLRFFFLTKEKILN